MRLNEDVPWVDTAAEHLSNKPVLIILEGILMYFEADEVMQLLAMLKKHFPGCTILAEIMHPFVATQTKHHDTVKNTSAVFKWGIRTGKDMERICEKKYFDVENDGFYGAYFKNEKFSDRAVILMLGE